jgi:hypothetical protein
MHSIVKLLTASALLLVAAVIGIATLGGSSTTTQSARGGGDIGGGVPQIALPLSGPASTPATAPSTVPVTTPTPSSASSNLLTSPVTYDQGEWRFDPVPSGFAPDVSADAAYQSFKSTGLAPNGSTPTMQLALYTAYGEGIAGPDGQVILSHVKQPVWVITYTNVPTSASGGASIAGEQPAPSPIVLHNLVGIVDAHTGQNLSELDALPDPTAYPAR